MHNVQTRHCRRLGLAELEAAARSGTGKARSSSEDQDPFAPVIVVVDSYRARAATGKVPAAVAAARPRAALAVDSIAANSFAGEVYR